MFKVHRQQLQTLMADEKVAETIRDQAAIVHQQLKVLGSPDPYDPTPETREFEFIRSIIFQPFKAFVAKLKVIHKNTSHSVAGAAIFKPLLLQIMEHMQDFIDRDAVIPDIIEDRIYAALMEIYDQLIAGKLTPSRANDAYEALTRRNDARFTWYTTHSCNFAADVLLGEQPRRREALVCDGKSTDNTYIFLRDWNTPPSRIRSAEVLLRNTILMASAATSPYARKKVTLLVAEEANKIITSGKGIDFNSVSREIRAKKLAPKIIREVVLDRAITLDKKRARIVELLITELRIKKLPRSATTAMGTAGVGSFTAAPAAAVATTAPAAPPTLGVPALSTAAAAP